MNRNVHIVMNPPYAGTRYLEFILPQLQQTRSLHGKMSVILPASPFIDLRDDARNREKYSILKEAISGHITSLIIENFNPLFNTRMYVPFALAYLDYSKSSAMFDYKCCGEHRHVHSLDDCALVPKPHVAKSILNKVLTFRETMVLHITKCRLSNPSEYYVAFNNIVSSPVSNTRLYNNEKYFKNGIFYTYWEGMVHHSYQRPLSSTELHNLSAGGGVVPKQFVHGSLTQMENWLHYITKNKLPMYLAILVTTNQHNTIKNYLPFLTDKKYSDQELYRLFHLSSEEIDLIDCTLEQYNRNSSWFRRFMIGDNSIEVNHKDMSNIKSKIHA